MVHVIPSAGKRCEQPLLLNYAHSSGPSPVTTESEFNALIEQTFEALEEALDQIDTDIDYQLAAYDDAVGDWRGTRDGQLFRPFVVDQMQVQGGVTFEWL
jgi:CyaY protein